MKPVSPLLKLALRLATGGSPAQRWRQVALVLAGMVTAVLALFVVGSANALAQIEEREFARTAIVGATDGPSLVLARRVDTWQGEQFPVLYLQLHPDAPERPLLPPGLSRLPEPGRAFVSPALAELIDDHRALADRYGRQPEILPDSALGRKDELLAYLGPPPGRSIAADERSRSIKGYGAEPHTPGTVSVADPSDLPTLPMLIAALALLGVPIGVLIAAAAATASPVRERRIRTLRWIGISRAASARLTLLEAGSLYLAGLILAGALGMTVLPSVTSIPLVGQRVVAGDLTLSTPQVVLTLLGLLAVALVVAAATDLLRRPSESGTPRPTLNSAVPSRIRYLPLGVSAAMLSVALLLPGKTGGTIALASVVAFLLGVPLIASTVLVKLGRLLQKLPYPATLLAGRRMERRPVTVARPLLGISVLTLLLTSGAGFLAVMGTGDPLPVRDPATVSYRVDALDLRDLDIRRMREALPSAAVLPYAFSPESGRLVLGGRCADVRRAVRTTCDPSRPFALDAAATDRVQRLIGGDSGSGLQLAEPATVAARGTFVLVPRGVVTDGQVRRAVSRSFVAPIVVNAEDLGVQRESPLVPWLYGGLTAAALCIGVAALVMATDGFLRARRENEVLSALGLTAARVTKFEISQFGFAYGATAGTSFLVGCALCVLLTIIGDAEAVPWIVLGAILLGLVGGAVAAASSLTVFGRLQNR